MTKRVTKAATKQAAYAEAMKEQQTKPKTSKARWVRHVWCKKNDSLRTYYWPAAFPGAKGWCREGSLEQIEQKENAAAEAVLKRGRDEFPAFPLR